MTRSKFFTCSNTGYKRLNIVKMEHIHESQLLVDSITNFRQPGEVAIQFPMLSYILVGHNFTLPLKTEFSIVVRLTSLDYLHAEHSNKSFLAHSIYRCHDVMNQHWQLLLIFLSEKPISSINLILKTLFINHTSSRDTEGADNSTPVSSQETLYPGLCFNHQLGLVPGRMGWPSHWKTT